MALKLRSTIIRIGLIAGAVSLVVGLAISLHYGGMQFNASTLIWPIVMAVGVGMFASWQICARIKRGVLKSLPQDLSFVALKHGEPVSGVVIDWESLDDYAIQLMTRGYTRLGEYTALPLSPHFVGVAACFVDRNGSTLVEVQYLQMKKTNSANLPDIGGTHFSIGTVLGGNITATTTDHQVGASHYLIRGSNAAVASYPGLGLMPLLEKHSKLVARLIERSGKRPSSGLNMHRYILLQRERFAQARRRMQRMGGYEIARQIDAFEADPRTNWATSSAVLAKLPERPLAELDTSVFAQGRPTILPLDSIARR